MNDAGILAWVLLRLSAQMQGRYVDHVKDTWPSVEVYVPEYQKVTRPHRSRKTVVVTRPVYPGYVFTRVDIGGRDIHNLVSCPVRARVIKFGPTISVIPDVVIA